MTRRAVGIGLLLCLGVDPAHAQPSVWDAARDPGRLTAYRALSLAETHLARAAEEPPYSDLWRRQLQAAVAALAPHAGAADPRVRVLLVDALSRSGVGWEQEITRLLSGLLKSGEDLDPSLAADAWYQLALAAAHREDRDAECAAYDRALELTWESDQRAAIYYNRADARLGLGQLDRALADYRRALLLSSDPDVQALSYYGLGITQERQGDLPSALVSMRIARSLQPGGRPWSVLEAPSTFFIPSYDLYYYKALEAMAAGDVERDPSARRVDYTGAAAYWQLYLVEAAPARHQWVPNARRHLVRCEREVDRIDAERSSRRVR